MNESMQAAWKIFEKTGSVNAYLNFKAQKKNELNFEAGEDFGVNKNGRGCDKGNQIR